MHDDVGRRLAHEFIDGRQVAQIDARGVREAGHRPRERGRDDREAVGALDDGLTQIARCASDQKGAHAIS